MRKGGKSKGRGREKKKERKKERGELGMPEKPGN